MYLVCCDQWKSSGFSLVSGTKVFTIESIDCLYLSTLSLVNIGYQRTTKMNEYGDFLAPEIQL